MRIIFSRKGFDSKAGGQPSPILPDGTLLSFPIPSDFDSTKYSKLFWNKKSYYEILKELKPDSYIKENYLCHLDPDLRHQNLTRVKNWVPLFGQVGAAQGHLIKKEVKEGDLFLFFGWFKETEIKNGELKYKKAPDQHIFFGYLQIEEIINNFQNSFPEEINYHSHCIKRIKNLPNNCIFKAKKFLDFLPDIPGAGCFKYHPDLVLTKNGYSRSRWDLPEIFKNVEISYHSRKSFKDDYFQSVARGQEFVLEANKEIVKWVKNKIKKGIC